MKRKMRWPCVVTAKSHLPSGKRITMRRVVDGEGDVVLAMHLALLSRRDSGSAFLGEAIHALTPLGQRVIRIYDADTQTLAKE